MQGSTSKLRNVYGEISKEKFEDVKPNGITTEGSLIDANTHFIAVSWASSGGGCVAVFDATNCTRLRGDLPLLRSHTGPVVDLKFSPFRSNLLATASDDATVRLWEIPQGGLSEENVVEQQKFTGHSKKVGLISFNPTVAEVVASAGFDNTLNVWNICNAESYSKLSFNDGILSLDWNHNGSLVGLTTKEKKVYLVDPRANKVELSTHGHDSGKTQKMGFLNQDYLFTCGFNKSNERQIKLFDMRNFTSHVQQVAVDSQTGIMMPYYDPDMGLLYVPGRGEGNVKYYDFSSNTIKFASEFRSTTQQKGVAFFPKRAMNYNKCEIARAAKLTGNTIEYLSFYVPKRNEGYDESVYPDCFAGEPALTLEEWQKGENRDAVRKNITSMESNWNASSKMTFEKKSDVVEEKKHVETDRVQELESFIKDLEVKNSHLVEENTDLQSQLAETNEKIAELKLRLEELQAQLGHNNADS